ncbi:MAG TPA: ABC transporter substrate-binding protein [Vicinamibacterales bacterium]|nr:ABC transporter substrate-binding protein [Vicinamibacterales bacterium]
MNRQSRALLTIVIVAIILIPYAYCARGRDEAPPSALAPPPTEQPTRGGTLIATARSEPRSFNRVASRDFPTELFATLTQGRLVRVNRQTQEIEPWLAEKWTTSDDGRSFTLTLRDGVVWSDGIPFTSADVLFTFQAVYDEAVGSHYTSTFRVAGKPLTVTAPDARTVVITYPAPFAPGIRQLDNLTLLPKHKLEAALTAGTLAKAWTAATPPAELVSIGPFMLTRYEPGQRLVYERNPRYWRRDAQGQQLPYLDQIVIEIIPEQDTEMVRLQAGQVDFGQQQLRATDIAGMRTLAAQGKLQLLDLGVSTDPDSFFFNLRAKQWANDPRGAWLPRKEFRQAISHAVDREAFAETVFLGEAVPIHGPVTPGNTRWFWPNIPRYEYSVEKARALLEGLGLKNRDQDEWLEDDNGTEARFTLQTFRGSSILERSAAVLRDDLQKIGIAVDVVALEANTVISRMLEGQFEAVWMAFQGDLDPALNKDYWLSSGTAHVWNLNQQTPATDWERQIDELMTQQASVADESERKRIFNDVQRIFSEHLPILHFATPRLYLAVTPRVVNLQLAQSRPQLLWSPDTLAIRGGGRPAS